MLKQKRTWNLIGCILGLVMLIVGLVFLNSPPEAYHTESAEYAAFGADYYTYQYDATKTVAENVAATANNLREIGTAQARYAGFEMFDENLQLRAVSSLAFLVQVC